MAMVAGLALEAGSWSFALGGWPMERLWLYLLGAAMLVLTGLQLSVFWVIMRVLEELNQR